MFIDRSSRALLKIYRTRPSQFPPNAHAHSRTRPPATLLLPMLALLPIHRLQNKVQIQMRAVFLVEPQNTGLPGLRNRRAYLHSLKLVNLAAHLHSLKLVDLTAHHTRAQTLLHTTQKARRKAVMALQAPDLLERRTLVLKANPAVEVTHRLQVQHLLVHQIQKIKVNPAARAVYHLQCQRTR